MGGLYTSEVRVLETKDSPFCTWRKVQSIYFVFCRNGELNYFPVTFLLCHALSTDLREVICPAVLVRLDQFSKFQISLHHGVPARLDKSYSKAEFSSSFILSLFFLWPSGALCGVMVFVSSELAIAPAHSEAWASWCSSELVLVLPKVCHCPKPRGHQRWQPAAGVWGCRGWGRHLGLACKTFIINIACPLFWSILGQLLSG